MRRGLEHAFLLIAALMVGIAIGLAFEADTAVRILFPASLEPAAGVLSILAFTLLPLCLEVVTASLILAQGRTTLALGTVACGLVVLGVLNVWLDPKYGAIGAAWARLAATILIATLNAAFALRGFGSHWLMRRLAGVALGAFLLGATLWVTRSAPLLAIPLGTVVYLAAMLLTGVVTRSDLTMVRHVLARRT
jgi:O-antigen/teichoic acid export membrane protein